MFQNFETFLEDQTHSDTASTELTFPCEMEFTMETDESAFAQLVQNTINNPEKEAEAVDERVTNTLPSDQPHFNTGSGEPIFYEMELRVETDEFNLANLVLNTINNHAKEPEAVDESVTNMLPATPTTITPKHNKGPKQRPMHEIDPKNQKNVQRCREYRARKKINVSGNQIELNELEAKNKILREKLEKMQRWLKKSKDLYLRDIAEGKCRYIAQS